MTHEPLELRDIGTRNGSQIFQLIRPCKFVTSFGEITVPAGFPTDGASVPRIFWTIFPPWGQYFGAAVLHDYLYSCTSTLLYDHFTRKDADYLFLEAMYNLGVPRLTRHTIHTAVRAFGGNRYKKS